jgi:hypothetical protein
MSDNTVQCAPAFRSHAITHPPGRLTLPRVLLTSRAFNYTNSAAANVQATCAREKRLQQQEAIEQQLAVQLAQPLLSGIPAATRRLRSGLHPPLALPQL